MEKEEAQDPWTETKSPERKLTANEYVRYEIRALARSRTDVILQTEGGTEELATDRTLAALQMITVSNDLECLEVLDLAGAIARQALSLREQGVLL